MYLRKNLGSIRQDCFNVPHGMKNAPFRNFVLHSDNGGAMVAVRYWQNVHTWRIKFLFSSLG